MFQLFQKIKEQVMQGTTIFPYFLKITKLDGAAPLVRDSSHGNSIPLVTPSPCKINPFTIEQPMLDEPGYILKQLKRQKNNNCRQLLDAVFSQVLQKHPCIGLTRSPLPIPQLVRTRGQGGKDSHFKISVLPYSAKVTTQL